MRLTDCPGRLPMMKTSRLAACSSLENEITGILAAFATPEIAGLSLARRGPRISWLPSAMARRAASAGPAEVSYVVTRRFLAAVSSRAMFAALAIAWPTPALVPVTGTRRATRCLSVSTGMSLGTGAGFGAGAGGVVGAFGTTAQPASTASAAAARRLRRFVRRFSLMSNIACRSLGLWP